MSPRTPAEYPCARMRVASERWPATGPAAVLAVAVSESVRSDAARVAQRPNDARPGGAVQETRDVTRPRNGTPPRVPS